MSDQNLRERVRELFERQRLAVLATHAEGQPHGSLMAFAFSDDLSRLYFVTPRATRKFSNLEHDERAAAVIDNRLNEDDDFREAMAVTASGRAREIENDERREGLAIYLARFPYLKDFAASPSCAFLEMRVEHYSVVWRFQNVEEIHLT